MVCEKKLFSLLIGTEINVTYLMAFMLRDKSVVAYIWNKRGNVSNLFVRAGVQLLCVLINRKYVYDSYEWETVKSVKITKYLCVHKQRTGNVIFQYRHWNNDGNFSGVYSKTAKIAATV